MEAKIIAEFDPFFKEYNIVYSTLPQKKLAAKHWNSAANKVNKTNDTDFPILFFTKQAYIRVFSKILDQTGKIVEICKKINLAIADINCDFSIFHETLMIDIMNKY